MSKRERDDGNEGHPGPCKVKPRLEPSSYNGSGMVKIVVGSQRRVFEIHKKLLYSQSPYCATFDRFNRQGPSDVIDLPNMQPLYFEIIFNWLYTGKLSVDLKQITMNVAGFNFANWIRLYHHADVLLMTNPQNVMVDADLAQMDDKGRRARWSLVSLEDWFDSELTQSPYYQLFIRDAVRDYFVREDSQSVFKRIIQELQCYPQALTDLLENIDAYRRKPWCNVENEDWCEWHIHENGERCERGTAVA